MCVVALVDLPELVKLLQLSLHHTNKNEIANNKKNRNSQITSSSMISSLSVESLDFDDCTFPLTVLGKNHRT